MGIGCHGGEKKGSREAAKNAKGFKPRNTRSTRTRFYPPSAANQSTNLTNELTKLLSASLRQSDTHEPIFFFLAA